MKYLAAEGLLVVVGCVVVVVVVTGTTEVAVEDVGAAVLGTH